MYGQVKDVSDIKKLVMMNRIYITPYEGFDMCDG